ncbi:hypothetical protein FRC03_009201 [Tulasnella sp. 419]|nr:hypothetical protein FRC03_009201 [Tulasnella sp. 419]
MAEPLGRHRDTFRPALRFPTDPYKSMELPTRTKDIMKGSSSNVGLNSNSQSKRPPWELTLEALPDGPSSLSGKRVVLIIGSPPQSALSTLLSSPYLYGSLVVIAVAESINLDLLPSATTPAIRILRIRSSSSSPEPEMYTASRLTTIFEWADRVAKDWRQDFERLDDSLKPNSFMTFYEDDEINGAYRTKRRHLSMIFKSKTRPYHDARSAEELSGSSPFSHWSSVTASTHSRNGSSATVSSISSSYFEPSGEGGGRSSFQSTESGPYPGESTSSTGNLLNTNDSSAAKTRAIRPSASSSTLTHLSTPTYKGNTRNTLPFTSSPLASSINLTRQRTRPISVFSTFSIPGMGPPKASRERRPSSNSSTLDKPKRSFDIIINFLPPAASHGTLGNGAIATLSSSAAHAKVLLKQTILVTTASQRFLLPPVVVRRSRPADNANGTSSPRSSLLAMPKFDDVIAPEIRDGQENNLGQPGGRRSRGSTSRRISQAFGSMFSVRTSTELPPTPPSSESASETSASPPLDNTQPSARSSVSEYPTMSSGVTNNQAHPVAKLVHVLPFEHACQAHQAIGTGVGNARLVRSLEAFLLSWSYGTSGSSLSTSSSGSSSSLNSLESGDGGSIQSSSVTSNGAKGKIKPFLLGKLQRDVLWYLGPS